MKTTLRVLVCALMAAAIPGAFAQSTSSDTSVGAIKQFHAWRHALANAGYTITVENGFETKNRKTKSGKDNGKMFNGFGDDLTFDFTAAKAGNIFNLATTYHYGDEPEAKKDNYADSIELGYGRALKTKDKNGYGLIAGLATKVYFDEKRAYYGASVRLMPTLTYIRPEKNGFGYLVRAKLPYFFKHTPNVADGMKDKAAFAADFDFTPAYSFTDKFAVEATTTLKNRLTYKYADRTTKHYTGALDLQLGVRYAISPKVNFAPYLKSEKFVGINQPAAHNAFSKPVVGFNLTAKLL